MQFRIAIFVNHNKQTVAIDRQISSNEFNQNVH